MLTAVLFDLDDTLYEERLFFRGGFEAVAGTLHERGIGPREKIVASLEYFHHEEGREGVFQKLAAQWTFPTEWIPQLVETFRSHKPTIHLADDVGEVLPRLRRHFKLGCVTDGWAAVQRAKLDALGAGSLVDVIVVADDFGRERWKPHAFPFRRCCELLGSSPDTCVFVGDNPERDMLGAYNAGLRSVRIRRSGGYFRSVEAALQKAGPVAEVKDFFELEQCLVNL